MITSGDVRRRMAEMAAQDDCHGAAPQPVVKADPFLSGAGPVIRVSKAAQRALSWGSGEVCVVQITRRGVVNEVRAVLLSEMAALERELGDDPSVDNIVVTQGLMESNGDGADWE